MSEPESANNAQKISSPDNSGSGGQRHSSWEWVPIFWQIAHRRLVQSQVRLLGFSLVVGLVAGLAAVLLGD
jgi:hypothetical protein